jgi:prepilin-type N-terminal cleavage/methylation domain-containing protein
MLRLNRKLSKKGFSLIELMVAVTILAIAAIGIFQAFTTGFQAMADAKDRTIATNIAQKKLEEVKNSVKVAYPYYSIETQEINDKTFTVIVVTNSIEDNLEQVYVTVSWNNRKGEEKNVQLETLVYDLKTVIVDEPDVGRIHLSADPTEITCCVVGETSTITAELFNTATPEQRVPSGTPVSFTVSNGSVDPEFTLTDTIGKATTQLTLNGKNPASVIATSGTVSSSDPGCDGAALEVTCVPKASEIALSADPYAILPGDKSVITATVNDTCGDVLSGELDQVDVKFVTDKGSFSNSTTLLETTITTVNGIATVELYMGTIGEVATVDGTITVDEVDISDSTTVICTDYSISVTANPTSINPGGVNNSSIITATLTTSGTGSVVNQPISFATDKGSLSAATANTDGNGQATVTLSSLLGGDIATITASYTFGAITISDTVTVQSTEYVINIVANPDKVIPGSPSTITATLTNYLGNPASNKIVDFYSTEGILSYSSVSTNSSGIAVTTLTLGTVGDIANVSASYGFATDTVNVSCIEFVLEVSANPESIIPGEISEITAILTNYSGTPQSGQTITFTTTNGTFTETSDITATAVTNGSGVAVVHLTLDTLGTTAIVTAEYDLVEDTVSVECSESIYITLHDQPSHWSYNYSDDSITFSIDLHGGPLIIDKVKINWETDYSGWPSRYRRIWIRISGGNWTQIYNRNHSNNGSIETLNLNSPYTLAADQTFEIEVNFSYTIRHKHVIFTLNPDDPHAEENYQVDFYTPY